MKYDPYIIVGITNQIWYPSPYFTSLKLKTEVKDGYTGTGTHSMN